MARFRLKQIVGLSIIVLFAINSCSLFVSESEAVEPIFTLVYKTNDQGVRLDYGNFLKQHLARIGINVEIIVLDSILSFTCEYLGELDYDIIYLSLSGGGADPDFTGIYNENGSLNVFGYRTEMDYNETLGTGVNEWYMRQGRLIMPPDSSERVQHYWAWEQYLMDEICPMLPTFAPKAYTAYWSNLEGYDMQEGIKQSWGKMEFSGLHDGQIKNTELVTTDTARGDFNPLFHSYSSSKTISKAILDSLIFYDSDLSVHPHLAESYTFINDTTVEIVCRDGIKWQDDPDGLFLDEYFDVEDVYFTLYSWANLSNDQYGYDWIKKMEIIDEMTMRIYIDGDPKTPENDPFAPALPHLATKIIPEHYLNQTQLIDGVTPDITDASWDTFETNCFGTSLFELDTFTEDVETELTVFNDCWWLDDNIDKTNMDFVNRFGDFTGGLDSWRIRIFPNTQTALLEFEAGRTDLEEITPFSAKRKKYVASSDFDVQNDTMFYLGFFGFNMHTRRPVIGNPNPAPGDPSMSIGLAVRKAISYALDREEINNVVHGGEYTITNHPIYSKMGIWCNPNIIRYNHDLEKAREYMAIAGFDLPYFGSEILGIKLIYSLSGLIILLGILIIVRKKK